MPTTQRTLLLDIADVTVLSGGEGALLLWDQQLLGDAVLLGQLLHGPALIGIAQHAVDVLRQIGALAAADAVLLLGEPVGVGEIGVAGTLTIMAPAISRSMMAASEVPEATSIRAAA